MDSFELVQFLKRAVNYEDDRIDAGRPRPGGEPLVPLPARLDPLREKDYVCPAHGVTLREPDPHVPGQGLIGEILVIPAYEVRNTLQGSARNLPARVEVPDFPYPYKHEDPFPAVEAVREKVDRAAAQMSGLAADFLASG